MSKGKPKGRTNQRAGLAESQDKLRRCMYGKILCESRAVAMLENYVYMKGDEGGGYGGPPDFVEHFKTITGQISEITKNKRESDFFQISVMAPLWRALFENDAKFFADLGKAIEMRNTSHRELPQHYATILSPIRTSPSKTSLRRMVKSKLIACLLTLA
jgi:hypothetical protein